VCTIRKAKTQLSSFSSSSHAQYSLEDFKAAANAFERGLKLDPNNAGLKSGLHNAKSRISTSDGASTSPTERSTPSPGGGPGLAGMAEMLGSMGGGGGGMPDLASLMNNPQFMSMAQQMMASGGLEQLMQNPSVANMVGSAHSWNINRVLNTRFVDESRKIR
jgi:small glutamine-rich tetratricopeptide repeat-containing protein alpha